jgi:hypothetical protein
MITRPVQPSISSEAVSEVGEEGHGQASDLISKDSEEKNDISDSLKDSVLIDSGNKNEGESDDNASDPVDQDNGGQDINETGESSEPENTDKDLETILNSEDDSETGEQGLLDESQNNQGKLEWNLIIFLLFLAAVIAWIFWVNRELIKERREKESSDDKNE